MLELIKKYVKMGIYRERELALFVAHGDITQEQLIELLPPAREEDVYEGV